MEPTATGGSSALERRRSLNSSERLALQRKFAQRSFDRGWPTHDRLSLKCRLEQLGITESQLDFLGHAFGPWGSSHQTLKFDEKCKQMDPQGWWPAKHKLNSPLALADHFLGRRAVLSTSRCWSGSRNFEGERFKFDLPTTRQVIIDLDAHNLDELRTIEERYWAIRELIDPRPLVFRSSDSGGLQLVWFLNDFYYVRRVADAMKRQLSAARRPLRPEHKVEIFPTTSMTPIRMPLGAFGAILDPETLEPVEQSFAETCLLVQMVYYEQGRPLDDFFNTSIASTPNLAHDLAATPAAQVAGTSKETASSLRHEVDAKVWQDGITTEYPRNEAIPCAIRHAHYVLGYRTEEELTKAVMDWIRLKHNNLSDRYPANPEAEERDVARRVRKHLEWAGSRHSSSYVAPRGDPRLGLGDYMAIIDLVNRFEGDFALLPRKTLRRGVVDLFAYVKSVAGASLNPTIPIPSTVMTEKFSGWNKTPKYRGYYRNWLDELDRLGILRVADPNFEFRDSHKCRTYKLNHEFVDRDLVDTSHEEILRKLDSQ